MSEGAPSGSLYGAVEAGGTKFVCAAGAGPAGLTRVTIPTTTPGETLGQVIDYFRSRSQQTPLASVGVASFGPVDLNPRSPTFGFITSTPKPGWSNVDICGALRNALRVPIAFDTDVNAAALAESKWGAAKGLDSVLYLTVGTGIGGGAIVNGRPLHGLTHPEMGHMRIPHDLIADPFPGCCPYHGDCLEGLASGPAIEQRWKMPPERIPSGHDAWSLEARYLAFALANLICTLSPRMVVLGGGVMRREALLNLVPSETVCLLNGYIDAPPIVPAALGENAGVLGALLLASGNP